jgi:hypothetical protein
MWQATVPFEEGAIVVRVDLPEDAEPAATSIGLQIVLSDGTRSHLGRAAAMFALDNRFEAVQRDQVGAHSKPAIDVSGCGALQGGWALYADEFVASGDTWHVVLEPPGSMARKNSQFPWGESMHFVVVTHIPDCAEARAAADRAASLVASGSDQDLGPCGGGLR